MSGLEELRRLEAAATSGPWTLAYGGDKDGSHTPVTSRESKAEFLALSLNDDESPLWLIENSEVIPAVTGDGPKAKGNAELIAAARNQLPRILDALDAVLAVADRLDASPQCEDREIAEDIRASITKALEGGQ